MLTLGLAVPSVMRPCCPPTTHLDEVSMTCLCMILSQDSFTGSTCKPAISARQGESYQHTVVRCKSCAEGASQRSSPLSGTVVVVAGRVAAPAATHTPQPRCAAAGVCSVCAARHGRRRLQEWKGPTPPSPGPPGPLAFACFVFPHPPAPPGRLGPLVTERSISLRPGVGRTRRRRAAVHRGGAQGGRRD